MENKHQPKAAKCFKPMVVDDPQDNVSTALNLFYVKDGWTWVRGGGLAPDYADVSLCDYVRQIAKEYNLDMAKGDDEEISMEMSELLFDGIGTMEGIVATLYTAAWAFAEIRERLKAYEATRKMPDELLRQMTTPFENDPFPIVYRAFKNLFPDKNCTIFYGVKEKDKRGEEGHGYTFFPDDGSEPEVTVFAENDTNVQAEILAHELAHVAVGQEHGHDRVWKDAFDAINAEYCRLSDEVFGELTDGTASGNDDE